MVSVARLVTTAAVAGGLLVGTVALGEGVASAAPAPSRVVPASCGQTVTAMSGDTVRVKPRVGVPQDYTMSGSPGTATRIPSSMQRPGCEVDVQMAGPATAAAPVAAPMVAAPMAAPGTAPIAGAPAAAPGAAGAPVAAAPRAALPAPAARGAAAAPGGRSAARTAPGSRAATPSAAGDLLAAPAPAALVPAAPGLGAPVAAPLPAAPDAQVVPTGNASALPPADDSHGLGVPVLIALIAGAGVAAFGVRMLMLRRGNAADLAAPRHDDASAPVPAEDPAERTVVVDPAEARTVVGSWR
ncbi:hypothetical protein [Actinomycetospora sp.]|jgi:hypothetical protein|uniref:hypothetical protein n=1 Tax=Actinomycetospora sp. TaxID=1872135 RepID=UPI002F41756E